MSSCEREQVEGRRSSPAADSEYTCRIEYASQPMRWRGTGPFMPIGEQERIMAGFEYRLDMYEFLNANRDKILAEVG